MKPSWIFNSGTARIPSFLAAFGCLGIGGWRDILDAMRTCEQTRQAIVKLNMAYVYRLRRAGFLEKLGLHYLYILLTKLR